MSALKILVIGAHPDDADIKAGGTSALWCKLGHEVQLVSVTNGASGHQTLRGDELSARRRAEAMEAGARIGASYLVMDNQDGQLMPTLKAREEIIRLIRSFEPDLILTHRPNDYHPDHRYTSLLVQDAAYMITVPAICPEVTHLSCNPVIMYFSDDFRKPCAFSADVVVDITEEMDALIDMLHCHVSQMYEWLPYNGGYLDQVPAGEEARREWLADRMRRRIQPVARRHRDHVVMIYGPEKGSKIEYVEAFEVSEYGSPLDDATRSKLFPFLPAVEMGRESSSLVNEWVDLRADDN